MRAYYNEWEPFAAQWLRNLIDAGHIAPGDVDERSITDVRARDLRGYTQVHFFAGIGGWSLALRMAGWPDDEPVWTGSCPCQPFSVAGSRKGEADERHLWPEMRRLIGECNPPTVFGEQVASKDGRSWLSGVRADLEDLGYAVGAADLCAAGVGAPHIRQRLWFVANTDQVRLPGQRGSATAQDHGTAERGVAGRLADTSGAGLSPREREAVGGTRRREQGRAVVQRSRPLVEGEPTSRAHEGGWGGADRLLCRDGKWRPVEPGTFPLAHGIPNRVGRLRAYGNAIVPQVAAEFIRAYRDTERDAEIGRGD